MCKAPSGRGAGGEGAGPNISPFRLHAQSDPSSNGCQGRWTIVYKPQPDTRKRPMHRRHSSVQPSKGHPPTLDADPNSLGRRVLSDPSAKSKNRLAERSSRPSQIKSPPYDDFGHPPPRFRGTRALAEPPVSVTARRSHTKPLNVNVNGERLFDCVQATWNLLEQSAGAALQEAQCP
jgi:hypothetical protein